MQVKDAPAAPARRVGGGDELPQLVDALVRALRAIGRLGLPPSVGALEGASQLVLSRARELGASRVGDLAAYMGLDPSTVSRQAHKLVEAGLMGQAPDPQDRRACLLEVTPAGHEALEAIRAFRTEQLSELLARWSAVDIRRCVRLLDRLAQDLQTEPETRPGTGATS